MVKDGLRSRLEESLETALELGRGTCLICVDTAGGWREHAVEHATGVSALSCSFPPIERRTFRPNSPVGGCQTCHGTGGDDTTPCPDCGGQRLGEMGRSIFLGDWSWPQFMALTVTEAVAIVNDWNASQSLFTDPERQLIASHIIPPLLSRLECLAEIGLGYLNI